MSAEVDRFIPLAAMLIAILIGFTVDVLLGTIGNWRIAAPIGLLVGFVARSIMRGKFRAR